MKDNSPIILIVDWALISAIFSVKLVITLLTEEKMIKELIHEGCTRGGSDGSITNHNELAFDIAISHRKDLFFFGAVTISSLLSISGQEDLKNCMI